MQVARNEVEKISRAAKRTRISSQRHLRVVEPQGTLRQPRVADLLRDLRTVLQTKPVQKILQSVFAEGMASGRASEREAQRAALAASILPGSSRAELRHQLEQAGATAAAIYSDEVIAYVPTLTLEAAERFVPVEDWLCDRAPALVLSIRPRTAARLPGADILFDRDERG